MAATQEKIVLKRLSHIKYFHVDMEKIRQFGLDFGWDIVDETTDAIYFGGLGPDQFVNVAMKGDKPRFGGAAFLVESRQDLLKAARLPDASEIYKLDSLGGGEGVTLKDCYGIPLHLIFGQDEKKSVAHAPLRLNHPEFKPRKGEFQRFVNGPASVYKLGHFGYITPDFKAGMEWYCTHFNIIPSDLMEFQLPNNGPIIPHSGFFRLDREDEYVDHHCFFIIGGPPDLNRTVVHHSSYEVHDFDAQEIGHKWLSSKSYELSWGLGRHLLGSQIFDYWFDPTGFRVEHYADGDILTSKEPTGHHRTVFGEPPSQDDLAIWAQNPMGPEFVSIKAA